MTDVLVLDRVSKRYGERAAVDGVSLRLPGGAIGCLLGPSGSGKTTLLRTIAGFEAIDQGTIGLRGVPVSRPGHTVPPEKRNLGMVFQDYGLFPHLTVERNIAFGLNGRGRKEQDRTVAGLLERTGLTPYREAFPHELSGGQQQRVALARSLAPGPDLILLDEPFSNLDVSLREKLSGEVRKIIKESGATALMVTHNQQEAFAMADEIGIMFDGRMPQWGRAYDLYHHPADRRVATFVGEGVLLPGRITGPDSVRTVLGNLRGALTRRHPEGTAVDLLIRPEDIVHDDASTCRAAIVARTYRGPNILFTLELASGERFLSLVPSHHDHQVGESLGIRVLPEELVVFGREGSG